MKYIIVKDFNLEHTMVSGQFFYFFEEDNGYTIIQRNDVFRVKQKENKLFFEGVEEDFIRDFFHLDFNLNNLKHDSLDKLSQDALKKYWGLRIIKQDLWQCIIGFVCSSASNIYKIKLNVKLLAKNFGEKIEYNCKKYYKFPEPGTINDLQKIKESKTGYRAKFIFAINEVIRENPKFLDLIRNSSHKEAKKLLMTLPGIGSKVADCIVLFALQDYESFPVDTWVRQIFEKYYLQEKMSAKQIEKIVDMHFPEGFYRGIIQQYLFHQERHR